jgi:hypothetical protein
MFSSSVYDRNSLLLIFKASDYMHLATWKGGNKEYSPANSIEAVLF